jgi:hypothetical protein
MADNIRVESCPFPAGDNWVTDTGIIQAETDALTFCSSGIYSFQRERCGFVNRTFLTEPNTDPWDDGRYPHHDDARELARRPCRPSELPG